MTRAVVIGGAGVVGSWMRHILEDHGWTVVSVDIRGADLNIDSRRPDEQLAELVCSATVVVLALPEAITLEVAETIVPLLNSDGLLVSTASVQRPLFESAVGRRLRNRLIGCNPMFRPTLSPEGRPVIVVGHKDIDKAAVLTVSEPLARSGAIVELMTPDDHDTAMSLLQALPHAALLATISALGSSGVDVDLLWRLAPPPARIMFSAASRILALSPHVYADIQCADGANKVRGYLVSGVDEVGAGNREQLLNKMEEWRVFLGDVVEKGAAVAEDIYAALGSNVVGRNSK